MRSRHRFPAGGKNLANKLAVLYAALFGLIFLVLSLAILLGALHMLIQSRKSMLAESIPTVMEHALEKAALGRPMTDPELLHEQAYDPHINMYIFTPEGALLNSAERFPMEIPDAEQEGKPHVEWQWGSDVRVEAAKSMVVDGEILWTFMLVANMHNEMAFMRILGILLIGANVLGLIPAILLGRYISRRMFAPIGRIIHETSAIGTRNVQHRLPMPPQRDELHTLTLAINNMLSRVEDSVNRQSRFAADASHELRTPLSVIKGHIRMLKRWGSGDQQVLEKSLDIIDRQNAYMISVTENLLDLARGESSRLEARRDDFLLCALFEEIKADLHDIRIAQSFTVSAPASLQINANRTMIKQLLLALIDNSRKFTAEADGWIALSAADSDQGAEICVRDNGVGMEQAHLARIFDPFYRADSVRSRKDGGAGLGLSIAKAIAEAHGGRIGIESEVGEGTKICIQLPQKGKA